MAHIVIDARESGTSTGRYVDKLIEYLHILKPKHNFTILTKPHRLDYISNIAPSFEVKASRYKEFTLGEQLGLLKQVLTLHADLVHFGKSEQPILYTGRHVTTIHDLTTTWEKNPNKNPVIHWFKRQVYKLVIFVVARRSKIIITPSKFVRDDVARFAKVKTGKIVATYEASDKIDAKPETVDGLDDQEFLMYVGRSHTHKNLGRLIEAFAVIKKSRPQAKLVFVGKKDEGHIQLEKLVESIGVKDVIMTGFVSEGQLRWLYEHTAAYVFPSLSEGFGLPPLEAMQFGAPVVSSNATCLPEVYKDAALYFDPLDIQDMADKIDQVLTDKAFAKSLGNKGLALVKTYSWERMAKQTLEVYEKALAG